MCSQRFTKSALLSTEDDLTGRARRGSGSCIIVIKLGSCPFILIVFGDVYSRVWSAGTSSIVHEKTHQPLLSTLSSVVETVIRLRSQGHKVILVSSGAIAVGLKRMDVESKPKSLSGKQASGHWRKNTTTLNFRCRPWLPSAKGGS